MARASVQRTCLPHESAHPNALQLSFDFFRSPINEKGESDTADSPSSESSDHDTGASPSDDDDFALYKPFMPPAESQPQRKAGDASPTGPYRLRVALPGGIVEEVEASALFVAFYEAAKLHREAGSYAAALTLFQQCEGAHHDHWAAQDDLQGPPPPYRNLDRHLQECRRALALVQAGCIQDGIAAIDGSLAGVTDGATAAQPLEDVHDAVTHLSIKEQKELIVKAGLSWLDCLDKTELRERAEEAYSLCKQRGDGVSAGATSDDPRASDNTAPGAGDLPHDLALD